MTPNKFDRLLLDFELAAKNFYQANKTINAVTAMSRLDAANRKLTEAIHPLLQPQPGAEHEHSAPSGETAP